MTQTAPMTFERYSALAHLVRFGNLCQLQLGTPEYEDDYWSAVAPAYPRVPFAGVHVLWMTAEGFAVQADTDPLFASSKVVPTEKAAQRLQDHGLTEESEGVGVHLSHCCSRCNSCKYSDLFCPAATGLFTSDAHCELCDEPGDEHLEVDVAPDLVLIRELESRGFQITKRDDKTP